MEDGADRKGAIPSLRRYLGRVLFAVFHGPQFAPNKPLGASIGAHPAEARCS